MLLGGDLMGKKKMMLNPDKTVVERIRNFLKNNGGYCPCTPERTEDTKCPCKKFREEQICCCGLYVEKTEVNEK